MPEVRGLVTKTYWLLASIGALYALLMGALTHPSLQRHALYAHKIHSGFWHDVNGPESFGFAKNQVTPFNISTPDGETLYGWHILPIAICAKYEDELRDEDSPKGPVDLTKSLAFKFLTQDSEARIIINFHGNAGNVAQGWRTDTYRSLASLNPHIHVITIDYRGFGKSTGSPTQAGLILDASTLVSYVIDTLGIPPERIVLLGQSLGTAVTSAVSLSFTDPQNSTGLIPAVEKQIAVSQRNPVRFKGIVMIASFTSLPELLKTYRIAGFFPLFGALRPYPKLRDFLFNRITETWPSDERIEALVRLSWSKVAQETPFSLQLLHAYNDYDIPYTHSIELFFAAANGTGLEQLKDPMRTEIQRETRGMRPLVEKWRSEAGDEVRLELVGAGGHNRVVTYSTVQLAVLRAFDLA